MRGTNAGLPALESAAMTLAKQDVSSKGEREGRTLAAHSREQLPTRSYSKTNRAQRAVTSAVVEKFSLGFRKAPAAIAVDPSYNTDPGHGHGAS